MLAQFQEKAQKAIVIAESIAFDLGHSSVGSEHLLLALLKMEDCYLAKAMKKYDIDYEIMYAEFVRLFGKKDIQPFYMEYSDSIKEIFNKALSIGKSKGEEKISLTTLCIALLKQMECVATTMLEKYDVPLESIENQLNKTVQENAQNKFNLGECSSYATVIEPTHKKIILERDDEVKQMMVGLMCNDKPNILLTGFAGVGKTACVEELARILCYEAPDSLKGYLIVALDSLSAISGTKYRGEFEKKIEKLMKVLRNKKVILFIDEGHTISELGGCEGCTSLGELLKPFLTDGKLKCIIATTEAEYQKFIASNVALARRFRKVYISEPKINKVSSMIQAKVKKYSDYHHVSITPDDLKYIITLSKDIPNRYFPDKALDIVDYTMASCSLNGLKEFDRKFARNYVDILIENK